MKRWLVIGCLVLSGSVAWAGGAKQALSAGAAAYSRQDYAVAAKAFEDAGKMAEAEHLDPSVAHFNEGLALLGLHKPVEAAARFSNALKTTDLQLQSHTYYNRGIALNQQALQQDAQTNLTAAVQSMAEAVSMFEHALTLHPEDRDAKINLELCELYIAALTESGKRAEELVRRLDQLISTYEYEQALSLISQQAPALARGLAFRPEAGKRIQEMAQKLKEVLGILSEPSGGLTQGPVAAPTSPPASP